jgi:hypothetical protein
MSLLRGCWHASPARTVRVSTPPIKIDLTRGLLYIHGCRYICQICGYVDMWMCGCVDVWMCGRLEITDRILNPELSTMPYKALSAFS